QGLDGTPRQNRRIAAGPPCSRLRARTVALLLRRDRSSALPRYTGTARPRRGGAGGMSSKFPVTGSQQPVAGSLDPLAQNGNWRLGAGHSYFTSNVVMTGGGSEGIQPPECVPAKTA